MLLGKTLFSQLMDFLPWTSFQKIVARSVAATTALERSLAPSSFA